MKITNSDKAAIKEKIDIVAYLEKRGHSLTPAGGMSFKMLCPVHNERTPSFHVSEEYQNFHCFGCGISGDVISLVMELDHLSFVAAIQELADEAGVKLSDVEEDPLATKRLKLRRMMNETKQWYRSNFLNLPDDHPGKLNFSDRNLLDQAMKDETVGWAPSGGLTNYLKQKNYTEEDMLDAGLIKRNDNGSFRESFRSRITWSLEDAQGNTLGFSARKILETDNGPKYLNSPQTLLYNKSRTLLGLSSAKKSILTEQRVYIVEGQTDVMAMNAAGFPNVVASCGTAFGGQHANLLMMLSQRGKSSEKFELVFCFDGDEAGVKAAKKVFEENKDLHLHSSIVTMLTDAGEPTDPCDYRKDFGDEKLRELIMLTKVNIVEFVLKEELKRWNVRTPEGQSQFINSARQTLTLISDQIQYNSYVRKIAGWTGVPVDELSRMMIKSGSVQRASSGQSSAPHIVAPQQHYEAPPEDTYYDEYYDVAEEAFAADVSGSQPVMGNPAQVETAPDPMELKMLSLIVKHPTETLNTMRDLGVTIDFFSSAKVLAEQIVSSLLDDTLNELVASNPTVSSFAYQNYDLGDTPEEQQEGLVKIVKQFMKYVHSAKIAEMNRNMSALFDNENADPVEIMNQMVQAQESINRKYLPKD